MQKEAMQVVDQGEVLANILEEIICDVMKCGEDVKVDS